MKEKLKNTRRASCNICLSLLGIICCFILHIKYSTTPFRVYDKIIYLEVVATDGVVYGLYDCRVELYLNGKVVIYHDCGEMQISDINDIKFYDIGEIK